MDAIDGRGVEGIFHNALGSFEEVMQRIEDAASKEARLIEREIREEGSHVKVRIERGNPLREIVRLEEDEGISAVVIVCHGKNNVDEIPPGSVSEKVIRKPRNPV